MKFLSLITSLFGEKKCYICSQVGHFFCPQCISEITRYEEYCYVCKNKSSRFSIHKACQKKFPLSQVIVLTRYRQNNIKKILKAAKYYGKYNIYSDVIQSNKSFFKKYTSQKNTLLIPIPMYFFRKWKRGYNQSQKIAKELGVILDIPVNNKILFKRKYTKQQSRLTAQNRVYNLENSFGVRRNIVDKNSTIYLVDDVVSTGSTLVEASKELRKNGFTDIRAIVLASD